MTPSSQNAKAEKETQLDLKDNDKYFVKHRAFVSYGFQVPSRAHWSFQIRVCSKYQVLLELTR
jgi:hypothetical protein